MRIGFIGLGNMGSHMARHLIHAGHLVTVHDSRQEAAVEHLALGARWADTPAACAADAELLITMLPNPRIVEEVLLRGGAAEALPEGALWIDMSTSTPAAADRIAAEVLDRRGVRRLDAPVSGMAHGAEAGRLQIFVGGAGDDFRMCLPVLETLGDPDKVLHVGPLGAGYTVKLLLNLILIANGAIPRGGRITVRLEDLETEPRFVLSASGPMVRVPPKFLELHSGSRPEEAIDAHAVQPYYTLLLAREAGMTISIRATADEIVLTAA